MKKLKQKRHSESSSSSDENLFKVAEEHTPIPTMPKVIPVSARKVARVQVPDRFRSDEKSVHFAGKPCYNIVNEVNKVSEAGLQSYGDFQKKNVGLIYFPLILILLVGWNKLIPCF